MKKLLLLMMLAFSLTFSACGAEEAAEAPAEEAVEEATEEESSEPATEEDSEEAAATRTVTDDLGELTVPQESFRIAASAPAHWSSVMLVGATEKLVAIDEWGTPWLEEKVPYFAELPVVFSANEVNTESLLAVEPDLVLYATRYGENFRLQLEDLGIAYVSGRWAGDTNLEQIKNYQLFIGEAIGGVSNDIAIAYGTDFDAMFADISARTADIAEADRPRTLHVADIDPLTIIVGESASDEWITLAGGINVANSAEGTPGANSRSVETTIEQVLEWNPQVIICDTDYNDVANTIKNDPLWASIEAVANDDIYIMPKGLMSWGYYGPEEYLMMPFAAKAISGELFADYDIEALTTDFYQNYYNIELNADDLTYIFGVDGVVNDIFNK